MPNFCPSCGAKVDEGYKFCLSCGAKLQSEAATNPETSNKNTTHESISQEPTTQQSTPPGQKKSNKNLLIVLISIIVLIVVIVIVIMFTGSGLDSRFIGEWEISSEGSEFFNWVFSSDGSVKMTGVGLDIEFATWNVEGNRLCFKMKENEIWGDYLPEAYEDVICYDFVFSNGDNTVSLSIGGSENFVLTKK
jgi:hypothetical protein